MGLDEDLSFPHEKRIVFDSRTCTPKLVEMYVEMRNRRVKKPGKTFCSPVHGDGSAVNFT